MRICWCDTETFSPIEISAGAYRYAEEVEVMVWPYAFDDGPVTVFDATTGVCVPLSVLEGIRTGIEDISILEYGEFQHPPEDLFQAFADPECLFVFHNAAFDATVIPAAGLHIPRERVFCTMAQALAHSLPGALDKLCDILAVPQDMAKLKDGKALIQLFCKPRPKTMRLRRATWETHPAEWIRFLEYAGNDILAMREVAKRLPKWNFAPGKPEVDLWRLDQKINARGVLVDLDLAHSAIESAVRCKEQLAKDTAARTFGIVGAATQRDALLQHIVRAHGVALPDLRASTVESVLDDRNTDLPSVVRELLEIRVAAGRNSSSKYAALIKAANTDGRLRGTLQFCGAKRTARWAGRVFQPQNLARVPKYLKKQYDFAVEAIKSGAVGLIYDNPMEVLGACVRGALVAPRGKKFCIADLSNIEGRTLAWAAGESWKVHAFREFDQGRGHDLYKLAYAKAFGVPVESVDDGDQRQIGKVMELALGYGGGVGAFITFAAAYGIDLDALAEQAIKSGSIPDDVWAEASGLLDWAKKQDRTYGLSDNTWIVCDSFKRLWRRAHPETVAWWREVEDAARTAIAYPGTAITARSVKFSMIKSWLRMELPSGRFLCYPGARLDNNEISYMGENQFSRKWQRTKTYSGKLVENAIQGIARDVLASSLQPAEDVGYAVVLHVHDEIIAETPDTPDYSAEGLARIMATNPSWAEGLPLAAAGFETTRYRKG